MRVTPAAFATTEETAAIVSDNALAVLAFLEIGEGVPVEDLAGETVGKDPLHAVARFDPDPPFFDGKEDQDPLVFALLSDTPGLVEPVCIIVRVVVPDRLHRGDDDGGSRLLQDFAGEAFHRADVLGGDDPGEVVDGAAGGGKGYRPLRRGRPPQGHGRQQCEKQQFSRKGSFPHEACIFLNGSKFGFPENILFIPEGKISVGVNADVPEAAPIINGYARKCNFI